jgi:MraZ protein
MWEDVGRCGNMKRFRGSFELKIDDKGRLRLPQKFLSVFETEYDRELFITSLNGENVLIYPMAVWEEIEERIDKFGSLDPDIDAYSNKVSYWGSESEVDSKNRILIPPALRKNAKFDKNVRVLGKTNHLVIWNEEEFKSRELGTDFTKEQLFRVSRILNGNETIATATLSDHA